MRLKVSLVKGLDSAVKRLICDLSLIAVSCAKTAEPTETQSGLEY